MAGLQEKPMSEHAALQLNDENFRSEVLESDRPVLVDFWAPWCPPCRQLGPTVEAIARDHAGVTKVAKVDVDANPATASTYGISSIPAVLVFRDGREVSRIVGLRPRAAYEQALRDAGAAI
jgi:thioredoxin 1